MNLRQPMRTDRRLWLACAAVAFVLLGFISLHTERVEHKIGPSYFWGAAVFWPTVMEWWRALFVIGVFAAVLTVPAAAFGWVAQAVIVAVRSSRSSQGQPSAPN